MVCDCCYPLSFLECIPCVNGLCLVSSLLLIFLGIFPFFTSVFFFSSFTTSSFFSPGAAADMDLFLLLPFPSSRFHFHILPALPKGIHLSQSIPDLPTALIIRECLPASLLPTSFSDPIPANFLVSTPGEERINSLPFFFPSVSLPGLCSPTICRLISSCEVLVCSQTLMKIQSSSQVFV